MLGLLVALMPTRDLRVCETSHRDDPQESPVEFHVLWTPEVKSGGLRGILGTTNQCKPSPEWRCWLH